MRTAKGAANSNRLVVVVVMKEDVVLTLVALAVPLATYGTTKGAGAGCRLERCIIHSQMWWALE